MTDDELERVWVRYQLDIASIRSAIGPLYNLAANARRAHTFYPGQGPTPTVARALMGATVGAPNGVPDALSESVEGVFAARTLSVMTASILLIWFDSAIQEVARRLSQPRGLAMNAGDDMRVPAGQPAVKASTLIWAAANAVRHVDEWFATSSEYKNPQTAADHERKNMQDRSMIPLATVFGCPLPITENVAFEAFQLLAEESEERGSFNRMELHLLRIGQDLVHRAGLPNAPIGVTVTERLPLDVVLAHFPQHYTESDGIGRAASSLPDTGHLGNVRPFDADGSPES